MSLENIYKAKQLVTLARNIGKSLKLTQHNLLILIEDSEQLTDVTPDLEQDIKTLLVELGKARGTLAESIAISESLYQSGLDALNGGGL
jgi:hypothetical protein